MNIHKANKDFEFDKLKLCHPVTMSGSNSYFTKLVLNDKPVYIESPEVTTKQGFVKNKKNMFFDLMFDSNQSEFIQWFESLETRCHQLVFEKSEEWFQNSLELDDIENAFAPPLKTYKSGKYQVCRCNVQVDYNSSAPQTKIYNENEQTVSFEEVNDSSKLISIFELQGVKFSTRSFQLEFALKQIMLIQNSSDFDKCLIKKSGNSGATTNPERMDKIGIQIPNIRKKPVGSDIEDIKRPQWSDDDENDENTENTENNVDDKDIHANNEINDQAQSPSQEVDDKTTISFDVANITSDSKTESVDETPIAELENTIDTEAQKEDQQSIGGEPETEDSTSVEVKTPKLIDYTNNPPDFADLEEIQLVEPDFNEMEQSETINIKNPNEVYAEIYKKAKAKARLLKKQALTAKLEAEGIKNTYMLDDVEDSDISDFEEEEEITE